MYKNALKLITIVFAGLLVFAGVAHPVLWAGVLLPVMVILLTRSPAVLIGMVFAFTFWMPTATIYVFAPRMYLLGMVGLWLVYDYIIHPQIDKKEKIIFVWILLAIIILIIVDLHTNTMKKNMLILTIRVILKLYISGPILALFIYRKIKKTQDLILMFKIISFSFAIPASIAILQYLHVDWAWKLPIKIASLSTKDFVAPLNLMMNHRPMGLHILTIAFTYQALIGISVSTIVAMYFIKTPAGELIYGFLAMLATIGGIASSTRSLLVSVLVADGYLIWVLLRRKSSINKTFKSMIAVSVLIIIMGLILYTFLKTEKTGIRLTDYNDVSRPNLWKAGLMLAMEHPFGIGVGRTTDVISEERANFVGKVNINIATKYSSHNYLLNQLVYFGVPGLIIILFMVIWPFVLVRGPPLAGFEWMKHMTLVILISLYINAFFHNGGLTTSVMPWSAIGLAMLYSDLKQSAMKDETPPIEPPS